MTARPARGETDEPDEPDSLDKDLAAWGLARAPAEGEQSQELRDDFDIWPENVPAMEIFIAVVHQQRIVSGFGGSACQGIDASALNAALDARQAAADQRWELFQDVLAMGQTAARVMNEKRNG